MRRSELRDVAPQPDVERLLAGFRLHRDPVEAVGGTVMVDLVLGPEAAQEGEDLVDQGAAVGRIDAHGVELGREADAEDEGEQEPSGRDLVQGGDLLGQADGVAAGEDHGGADLQLGHRPGRVGQSGEGVVGGHVRMSASQRESKRSSSRSRTSWANSSPGATERRAPMPIRTFMTATVIGTRSLVTSAGTENGAAAASGSQSPGGGVTMDPIKAAEASGPAIVGLPAGFMLDGATYVRGGELGFDGIDFYVVGRGGALGEVDGIGGGRRLRLLPSADHRGAVGPGPGGDGAG